MEAAAVSFNDAGNLYPSGHSQMQALMEQALRGKVWFEKKEAA